MSDAAQTELITQETIDSSVLIVTLNRPDKLNSFTFDMAKQLQAALSDAAEAEHIRAVVLTGAGKGFCAGQDLAEAIDQESQSAKDLRNIVRQNYNTTIRLIREIPKPTIAAVNGVAAGAGANLAFACDFVFAAEGVSFIQAFSKIGLIPDTAGTFFLPRLVGLAKATELMFLGEKLRAEDAKALGAIYEVAPGAELLEQATALAKKLSVMPTRALFLTRQLLEEGAVNNLSTQLEREAELQAEAGSSEDFAEGVRAFLEKRAPEFTGR